MTVDFARILVTGATGLLGQAVVLHAASSVTEVVATAHTRTLRIPGVRSVELDLRDLDAVRSTLAHERPQLVVHTAALGAVDQCETEPQAAFLLNASVPEAVAQACATIGARLVHISSDAVYGDAERPFTEQTVPAGTSVYAASKLRGEQAVLAALPTALVLRTNFFGWSGSGSRSLAEFFHTALTQGEQVPGFVDVEFSPLYQRDLAELLVRAAGDGITGIRNLGSAAPMSKYAFGRSVAEVFGLDPDLVRPASRRDAGPATVRSAHLSMDSSMIAGELGVGLPTTREGVDRLFADFQAGLPALLRSQVHELREGNAHGLQDR